MKYIRKISLPALLRYNFGDQSEAVRQDVKARGRCDVRYIRSTKQITGRTFFGCDLWRFWWINGYGWISIALVIFAKWNPLYAILGTFVFGFFDRLQVFGTTFASANPAVFGWLGAIPVQIYKMLPFLITAIVLVIASIRKNKENQAPAAIGLNYIREER